MKIIYFAGGCLWGGQAFIKTLPGVKITEAGRANGKTKTLAGDYDGYAECVKTKYEPSIVSLGQLIDYFFEIIDPYSLNKQGSDVGQKYRTGIYSKKPKDLKKTKEHIKKRSDFDRIVVKVLPLTNYVKSAEEHQDRLEKCPDDYCHIPKKLLNKY